MLQILAEQTTPSPDLISTVKHLYETKLKVFFFSVVFLFDVLENTGF